jgi:hypothetical protein
VKILACALKNKIKNKNFLKLLEGHIQLKILYFLLKGLLIVCDPLIMSREPMATAHETFNFWLCNRNNYNP